MDTKAFLFNRSADGHFKVKSDLSLTDQQIAVDNKGSHFQALFQDVFADYQNPPLTGDVTVANKAWRIWISTPSDWWQCQLNFTLWCATAGCGVSLEDHLQAKDPLLASLYWVSRLLYDQTSSGGSARRPSWRQIPFLVSERL